MNDVSQHALAGRALVLSFTAICGEPRAVRQAVTLRDAGLAVTLAGFAGGGMPPAGCKLVELPRHERIETTLQRVMRFACLQGARVSDRAAGGWFWLHPANREAFRRLNSEPVNLVVANDYHVMPLAERIAQIHGARLVVDCHEYAMGEYPGDYAWQLLYAPYVDSVQRRVLRAADAVTTVSNGIAHRLAEDYSISPTPTVVRNVPPYEPQPMRPCGARFRLLYHGLLAPMREPELLIGAAALLGDRYHLVLRGPGNPAYTANLRFVAAEIGATDLVTIEPPVPLSDLVSAANTSDVGVFIHRDLSPQMRYVLPNKLFEYIMAGLAVCVSDLPEMTSVVREYEVGIVVREPSPEALATALGGLTQGQIDAFKRNALLAAKVLNWDAEKSALLRACGIIN